MSASRGRLRAVIFDRDFTLFECGLPFYRAAAEVCATLGYARPTLRRTKLAWLFAHDEEEYWATLLGVRGADVIRRAEELFRRRIAAHLALARPYEAAREALTELRDGGLKLALVSALPSLEATKGLLEASGLAGLFEAVATADLLGPELDIYTAPHAPRKRAVALRALALLGVEPRAAALVGDTDVDVRVAKELGLMAVAFYGPNYARLAPLLLAGPDVVVASLRQLGPALLGAE
ncbi:MAG: hypothetical protein C4339_01895 [Nitrososphaerota archaeon]